MASINWKNRADDRAHRLTFETLGPVVNCGEQADDDDDESKKISKEYINIITKI